jgi:hypothetical protein
MLLRYCCHCRLPFLRPLRPPHVAAVVTDDNLLRLLLVVRRFFEHLCLLRLLTVSSFGSITDTRTDMGRKGDLVLLHRL